MFLFRDLCTAVKTAITRNIPCLRVILTESNTWSVPETEGAVPQGGYGHTSTFDASSGSLYVHGGYKALPANKYGLVDDLYRYNVNSRTWLAVTLAFRHILPQLCFTVLGPCATLCLTCSLVMLMFQVYFERERLSTVLALCCSPQWHSARLWREHT